MTEQGTEGQGVSMTEQGTEGQGASTVFMPPTPAGTFSTHNALHIFHAGLPQSVYLINYSLSLICPSQFA